MARLITYALSFVVLAQAVINADEIVFHNGKKMQGRVLEYANGTVKIQAQGGAVFSGPISRIKKIQFTESQEQERDGESTTSPTVRRAIVAAIARAERQEDPRETPRAIIAMYIDTEDRGGKTEGNRIGYRCYRGYGYSGDRRVPLRQACTEFEYIVSAEREGPRRIELDPGPPYKTKEINVNVKAGEVVNLGRVVLEKVQADGTASIYGLVKDPSGKPLPNVSVAAGNRKMVTDEEGKYRLDGFGLETVQLQATQTGFYGGNAKVSIRDMSKRDIEQDLFLYRPRKVKIRYVISEKNKNTFEGPNAQEGTFETTVDSLYKRIDNVYFSSASFREFASDVRLRFYHRDGKVMLDNFMAPIYYRAVNSGATFESIDKVGNFSSQSGPPPEEGTVMLIRGFRKGSGSGVSDYCVKILVEEFSVVQ